MVKPTILNLYKAIMIGTLEGAAKGALWGGITAGVAFGVAEGVGALTNTNAHGASFFNGGMSEASVTKAIAHGLSRAAIQKVRYGTGKGAFLSGFVSSGFSVGKGAGPSGAFAMAIVGGTTSVIGGGKFANGAMGSAFQYLFNDYMDKIAEKVAFGNRSEKSFLNDVSNRINKDIVAPMVRIGKGTMQIYNGLNNDIQKFYNNMPIWARQSTIDLALTITEFGITKPLPLVIAVPYDTYSGANFNTIPTSSVGGLSYLNSMPLE